MRKSLRLLGFLLLVSPLLPAQTSNAKQRTLALTHVTVIDTTGGPAQPDMTVVIRGDRIAAIGRSGKVRVPAGSQVVDATGKFLIPGLWDMNVYWYDPPEYLPLFIANGVTGLREGVGYAEDREMRDEIEAGRLLGPRMVIPTRWVVDQPVPPPNWDAASGILVTKEADAREAVIDAQRHGADFIQIGGSEDLPRNAFFGLADEAKKRGIPIEGHVPASVTVEEASNVGLKSIDDVPSQLDVEIFPACSSHERELLKLWQKAIARRFAPEQSETPVARRAAYRARMQVALDTYDQKKADALFALLKTNHTWLCPTLSAQRNSGGPPLDGDPHLKYVSPANRKWWDENPYWLSREKSAEDDRMRKRIYQKYLQIIGAARQAGVGVLAGTTGEEPYFNVPGFSLHGELAVLVKAGFTPLEALQAATLNPARFLSREKDFGSVAPGKFADLVLLDANPLHDIGNTRKISAVVYRGRLYPRALLDAMLAKIESLADRKSIGEVLEPTIKKEGVEAAIREYRQLEATQTNSYDFEEKYELQHLGNELLDAKKFEDAIQMYKLNAEEFPDWWWVYDSLGEAYTAIGQKDLAIENYKKSLKLDPGNQHAALMLKQLMSQ